MDLKQNASPRNCNWIKLTEMGPSLPGLLMLNISHNALIFFLWDDWGSSFPQNILKYNLYHHIIICS